MFKYDTFTQTPGTGAVGQILAGVEGAVGDMKVSRFRAAVAYASLAGAQRLVTDALAKKLGWGLANKRWLISMDFGRSEPKAIEYLLSIGQSDVRVHDGNFVVNSPAFRPRQIFHPKIYSADDHHAGKLGTFGTFIGSGNLTVSGLATGIECGVLQRWCSPISKAETPSFQKILLQIEWFNALWASSIAAKDILKLYKSKWIGGNFNLEEESTAEAELFKSGPNKIVSGTDAVRFAKANALWTEVGTLYKNRGKEEAGNQVDLPRGARVFFGFPSTKVNQNTVFGSLCLQVPGFEPIERTVRFGDNSMDKINLPVPGVDGPSTYDNKILLWRKTGLKNSSLNLFTLRVLDNEGLKKEISKASASVKIPLKSGRPLGLLF
jgi:hypothetical protein